MARVLTKTLLVEAGFHVVGKWQTSVERLTPPDGIPATRGVYAFAHNEEVLYVGLASRSLRQRLNFYARPGASQTTNIRLNAMIRDLSDQGAEVIVLIAQPEDQAWNGFRISGPEGLEAALIEDFSIPWNLKGSTVVPSSENAPAFHPVKGSQRHKNVAQAIIEFVKKNPKSTELQIAKGVFGPNAVQQRSNPYCRRMVESGVLERLPTRPATYVMRKITPT